MYGTVFIPRWFSCVAAINDSEIVILGGIGETDGEVGVLSDVIIFNTNNNSVE